MCVYVSTQTEYIIQCNNNCISVNPAECKSARRCVISFSARQQYNRISAGPAAETQSLLTEEHHRIIVMINISVIVIKILLCSAISSGALYYNNYEGRWCVMRLCVYLADRTHSEWCVVGGLVGTRALPPLEN